jgi:hypothetical protein
MKSFHCWICDGVPDAITSETKRSFSIISLQFANGKKERKLKSSHDTPKISLTPPPPSKKKRSSKAKRDGFGKHKPEEQDQRTKESTTKPIKRNNPKT